MKKGDTVVRVLIGGGVKTASLAVIGKKTKQYIQLECDSSLKYDPRSLREIEPALPGWYSEIIPLES